MYRSVVASALAGALGVAGIAPVAGELRCRPTLAVTDVHFSAMIPPTMERKWTARVSVDASRCEPNASGYFEIVFTRLSEFGPDLDFRERYAWQPPSVEVALGFAANESVEQFRVDNVTGCACVK